MTTVAGPDLVVGACLVVKWYIPEIHSTEAERFLPSAFTLDVPDLFYPERRQQAGPSSMRWSPGETPPT